MEYLKDLMDFASESHGLTIKQIVKLGIDICTALEACHAKNIIHRDIKPANIMVSPDGYFKLGGIIELVYIVLQSVVKPGITGFFKIDLHIKCYIYLS